MYGSEMFVSQKFAVGVLVAGVFVGLSSSGCAAKTYVVVPQASVSAPSSAAATTAAAPPAGGLLNGTYKTLVGSVEATWTIESTCAAACTAVVSSSNGGWTGKATLTGDRWDITVERPDGGSCRNATTTPAQNHYSWDSATLKGTVDSSFVCVGEPPGLYHSSFSILAPAVATNSSVSAPVGQ